jgi:hypothetical protein
MTPAAPSLSPPQRRALALIGVDVWVLRARDAARESGAATAPVRGEAAAAPHSAGATPAAPRVVFAADGAIDFDGPAGPLLRHLALALGVDPAAVAFGAPREGLPCVCFGSAPGAVSDALLAPPLATLRASARARRALWIDLRALARRLRG